MTFLLENLAKVKDVRKYINEIIYLDQVDYQKAKKLFTHLCENNAEESSNSQSVVTSTPITDKTKKSINNENKNKPIKENQRYDDKEILGESNQVKNEPVNKLKILSVEVNKSNLLNNKNKPNNDMNYKVKSLIKSNYTTSNSNFNACSNKSLKSEASSNLTLVKGSLNKKEFDNLDKSINNNITKLNDSKAVITLNKKKLNTNRSYGNINFK